MVEIVEPSENLIEKLYHLVVNQSISRDFRDTSLVFPSQRIGVFLQEHFNREMEGVFLPPSMMTTDQFVEDLYKYNFKNFRIAEGPEAAIMIYRVIKSGNYKNIYTGYKGGEDFATFHPWSRELVKVVEELLVEGANLEVNFNIYERFVELGDYHLEYKDFISFLPNLVKDYMKEMEKNRLFSRGISYRKTAELGEQGVLKFREHKRLILGGINAFNRCEEKIFRFVPEKMELTVVVKSEIAALKGGDWPYYYQKKALDRIGEKVPATLINEGVSEEFSNIEVVPVTNRETGMIILFNSLKEELGKVKEGSKIGVVMADPNALLPFIQGVVSRFTEEESSNIAFNISMGYPMGRTPVFQLIKMMLSVKRGGLIPAADYLNLIRHPYVKLSAKDQESCRYGIWSLSKLIVEKDISGIDLKGIISLVGEHLISVEAENPEAVIDSLNEMHHKFFITAAGSAEEILRKLRTIIEDLKSSSGTYLLLKEYVNSALHVIDGFLGFSYPEILKQNPANKVLDIFLRELEASKVQFHGTPLMGVQVMGMLEFRGLSFDKLFVMDAVEGVLPEVFKYDPILPSDIRRVFNIRDFDDLEQLYAYNFFTMVKSASKVTLFYPENQKGDGVRSRYIEKILFEKQKAGEKGITKRFHIPFTVKTGTLMAVEKRDFHIKNLKLSPSMVEEYIACPLRFYYKNILKLRPERTVTDVMESDIIGVMIHELMEEFYNTLTYEDLKPELVIEGLRKKWNDGLNRAEIKNLKVSGFEPDRGTGKIRFRTIADKLYDYLDFDMKRLKEGGIKVVGHEVRFDLNETIKGRGLSFTGRVDRIEKEGDIWRILDYKTGASFTTINNPASIDSFSPSDILATDDEANILALGKCEKLFRNFQILMYMKFCMEKQNLNLQKVDGAYAFILDYGKFFAPAFKVRGRDEEEHKEKVMSAFEGTLENIIEDIFTRDRFLPNPTPSHCKYCHFRISCRNN